MIEIVGVRYKPCSPLYVYRSLEETLQIGEHVVVEYDMGLTIARVLKKKTIEDTDEAPLKCVIRKATQDDYIQQALNKELAVEAREYCIEKIIQLNLPMKLVGTESTLDKRRLIFYFVADKRIDFREIVRLLALRFKTRIEMRQIGVRDAVKYAGGLGLCGREVCCKVFLHNFEPISIKMAKKQDVVINPNKLPGLCGRLMCCLAFEDGDVDDILCCDTSELEKINY